MYSLVVFIDDTEQIKLMADCEFDSARRIL
jgi:hypothetical protein